MTDHRSEIVRKNKKMSTFSSDQRSDQVVKKKCQLFQVIKNHKFQKKKKKNLNCFPVIKELDQVVKKCQLFWSDQNYDSRIES